MPRTRRHVIAAIAILILSIASIATTVSAQDAQTDRHSIRTLLISGNDNAFGGSENCSNFKLVLGGTNPETGLDLNLTVTNTLSSEMNLTNVKLLIINMPSSETIPNSTLVRQFLGKGGSLFLISDYNGGGILNCSSHLNDILSESGIGNVTFLNNAISISNSSPNWRAKTFANNSLAVLDNSSMFQLLPPAQPILGGLKEVVTLSCGLNISKENDASFVGQASAQSDSGLNSWLLMIDNGRNRSVLCGSGSMFNNTYLGAENNQNLLKNLVLWLIQRFQTSPPPVYMYMVVVSSAITVAGIVVYVAYMKRRTSP